MSYFLLFILCGSLATSAVVAWLLLHTSAWHLKWTGDAPDSGPQKLHDVETTRIGGLAIAAGLMAGLVLLLSIYAPLELQNQVRQLKLPAVFAALMPLLALGVVEDITRQVGVRTRLLVGMAAAAIAYQWGGVQVTRLDLPLIDPLMVAVPAVSLVFTMIAVCGMVHAMNIIDGLNGLLAGVSLVALGGISWVAGQHGELAIMAVGLVMIGATLGFAAFNFPGGRLFCGDGGAYLLGFMVAVLSILLVRRGGDVSPWFAMAIVIHPVTETLYSAFRRWRQGLSPTHPDASHLHSLWSAYLRARSAATGRRVWLGTNAGAAWRCAALAGLPCVAAALFPSRTGALQIICLLYIAVFIYANKRLARLQRTMETANGTVPVVGMAARQIAE